MCDRFQRLETQAYRYLQGKLFILQVNLFILLSSAFFVAADRLAVGQIPPPLSIAQSANHSANLRKFETEVWAKVGERTCLRCHSLHGDAKESDFKLVALDDSDNDDATLARNHHAFQTMATKLIDGQAVLLQKVVGSLDHGGAKFSNRTRRVSKYWSDSSSRQTRQGMSQLRKIRQVPTSQPHFLTELLCLLRHGYCDVSRSPWRGDFRPWKN